MKLTKKLLKKIVKEELEKVQQETGRYYRPYGRGGDDEAAADAQLARADAKRVRDIQSQEIAVMNAKVDVVGGLQDFYRELMGKKRSDPTPQPSEEKLRRAMDNALAKNPILKDRLAGLSINDILEKEIKDLTDGFNGINKTFGPGKDFDNPEVLAAWQAAVVLVQRIAADAETVIAPEGDDVGKIKPVKFNENKQLKIKLGK